jgi:hypothetical protein
MSLGAGRSEPDVECGQPELLTVSGAGPVEPLRDRDVDRRGRSLRGVASLLTDGGANGRGKRARLLPRRAHCRQAPVRAGPLAMGLTDGRLMAMVVAGSQVEHATQWQAGDENWPSWSSLGHPSAGPVLGAATIPRAREIAELFVLAQSGPEGVGPIAAQADLWHLYQASPDEWSRWESMGHPAHTAGVPTVAVNSHGRLEVFTIDGGNGVAWHIRQANAGDPHIWGSWAEVAGGGSHFTKLAAEPDTSGRLVLAATTFGSDVWTTTESAPGSGTFRQWAKLGDAPPAEQPGTTEGLLFDPALVCDRRGLMQCLVTDSRTSSLYQFSAATVDHWQPVKGVAWPHP